MNRFTGMDLQDARALYIDLIKAAHPDHGGDLEEAKCINAEWQAYTAGVINNAFTMAEAEREGKTGDASATIFADILRTVLKWDMDVELIGFWIYAFRSFEYHAQLKELGFWFSKKHRAWIYSGTAKRRTFRTHTTEQNRAKWGSQTFTSEYREAAGLPA
jgi:hypothetical protein